MRRRFLGVFYHAYGHDILFKDAECFEQTDNMPSIEGPKCNGQAVSETKTFKDDEILYMYIAQRQGQITHEDKILTVTKRVCYTQGA